MWHRSCSKVVGEGAILEGAGVFVVCPLILRKKIAVCILANHIVLVEEDGAAAAVHVFHLLLGCGSEVVELVVVEGAVL